MPDPPESDAAAGSRRHRRFIASARGNLPVWAAEPPSADVGGQGFILIGLGASAPPVVARWRDQIAALKRPVLERLGEGAADQAMLDWLDATLAQVPIGWRLMLAGPPSEALVLTARARAAGMIDDEIRAFAIDDGHARAHCIHCGTVFKTAGGPGAEAVCPGCGSRLFVHRHFSRDRAALVAFKVDFEKAP